MIRVDSAHPVRSFL